MCFSAAASFTAGIVLISTGLLTARKAKKKSDYYLASVPILFGVQQMIEGGIWVWPDQGPLHNLLTYCFVFFAYVFWPIYIPSVVLLLEHIKWRRRILRVFQVIGAISVIGMIYAISSAEVSSYILKNSVCYDVHNIWQPIGVLYVIALCFSFFFSSNKFINRLGLFSMIAVLVAYYFYTATFASVWCFFAAIISISIYWQVGSGVKAFGIDKAKIT